MKKDNLPDDLHLTEVQVRKAIELAVREPPESTGLTLAQLREIAAELDIDEATLTKAVRQILADETLTATPPGGGTGAPAPVTSRFLVGRATALGSIAAALGVFTTYVESAALDGLLNRTTVPGSGAFIDVPVTLLLIVVTIVAGRARRFPKEALLFLGEATATWLGYALGWAICHGAVTLDLTRLTISAIAGSAFATWFLSRRGDKRSRVLPAAGSSEVPDISSSLSPGSDGPMRRVTHWAAVLRRISSLSPRESAT